MTTKLQIAVLDRAWVYIGKVEQTETGIIIHEAKNIRRWGTKKGLGQLAFSGPTDATRLDDYGTVVVPQHAILHLVDVTNHDAWAAQFPAAHPETAAA